MNQYSFPDHIQINPAGKDLVTQLLRSEPEQRLTLDQIMRHEFMSRHDFPKTMPSSTLACPPS